MKSFLREPLLHFLLLGGLLFLFFEWRGGAAGPLSTRIVVTPGVVEHLTTGFSRTWRRPPTETELKAMVDDYVKEEIATREATAMGLDRDDTIIRRRLRQKLEFLAEESVAPAPPTDAEVRAWLGAHPGSFGGEVQLALRQVFVRGDRRGDGARAEAERLLARLQAAGTGTRVDDLGDPTMLPREMALGPLREVSRTFGEEFAARLAAAEPGRWTGPIESSYGLHLVLVLERVAAEQPRLEMVRPRVERELAAERGKRELQRLYDRMLAKYTVTIERPKAAPAKAGVGGANSR